MGNKKTNKKTETRGVKVNNHTDKKVKVGDVVTTTRGSKRGTVAFFSGNGAFVTVDFFDGTTKDFKSGNVRKA
jgi:hypothetical protein